MLGMWAGTGGQGREEDQIEAFSSPVCTEGLSGEGLCWLDSDRLSQSLSHDRCSKPILLEQEVIRAHPAYPLHMPMDRCSLQ